MASPTVDPATFLEDSSADDIRLEALDELVNVGLRELGSIAVRVVDAVDLVADRCGIDLRTLRCAECKIEFEIPKEVMSNPELLLQAREAFEMLHGG